MYNKIRFYLCLNDRWSLAEVSNFKSKLVTLDLETLNIGFCLFIIFFVFYISSLDKTVEKKKKKKNQR